MGPWLLVALGCDEPDKASLEQPWSSTTTPAPQDSDGDGVLDPDDCAPDDPLVHPGAPERCNGIDDDCDDTLDPIAERDTDGDGALWCEDCDDDLAERAPGLDDPPGDGLDSDCDGTDGVGTRLSAPFWSGGGDGRSAGWALAAGDFDGDNCDDLLLGEPALASPVPLGRVALGTGCWPWAELSVIEGEGSATSMGQSVSLGPRLAIVHEAEWQAPLGRVLVYDEPFGPGALPRLEVRGAFDHPIDSAVLLAAREPWLLLGSQDEGEYLLVDLARQGTLDLELEPPDLFLATDAPDSIVGSSVGDVGDRDGDGEVDLGVIGFLGRHQVRFFPQLTSGHADDAPEIWSDDALGTSEHLSLGGGGDLDGDGLDEALEASSFADGQQADAGRAFLVPWSGAGERVLEEDAPTRLDGEFAGDRLGFASEVADLDGDGQDDLVLGAPGISGKVLVYPGPLAPGVLTAADASAIWVAEGLEDEVGTAVAAGDFDGSGRLDVAIGAAGAERGEHIDAGAVYMLLDPL